MIQRKVCFSVCDGASWVRDTWHICGTQQYLVNLVACTQSPAD